MGSGAASVLPAKRESEGERQTEKESESERARERGLLASWSVMEATSLECTKVEL